MDSFGSLIALNCTLELSQAGDGFSGFESAIDAEKGRELGLKRRIGSDSAAGKQSGVRASNGGLR